MTIEEFTYELNDLLENYKSGIIIPSNKVILCGARESDITVFKSEGLKGYQFTLVVNRDNNHEAKEEQTVDFIEVVVSLENDYMLDREATRMQVVGKVCSRFIDNRLQFYVEATRIGYNKYQEDVNLVYMVANLMKRPELKITPNGMRVCNFSLNLFNMREEKMNHVPCIAFNGCAEKIYQIIHRQRIAICGRINSRDYTKDGEVRRASEILVFFTKKISITDKYVL